MSKHLTRQLYNLILLVACGGVMLSVLSAQVAKNTDRPMQPTAKSEELPPSVWVGNTNASPRAANHSPSYPQRTVEAFIQKVVSEDAHLCDCQFKDLNGAGLNELVASVDYSGRDFCNTVGVISKPNAEVHIESIPAWSVAKVSQIIRDLNGDGVSELVIPQAISDYEGVNCIATWQRVYRWDGDKILDVSAAFPRLFRERLQELDGEIRKFEETLSPAGEERLKVTSCYYLEHDKIERFLGTDPKAGFGRAVQWMKSSDPSLRRKAVQELAGVNDQESRRDLGILSRDVDPSVAAAARHSLESPLQK